MNEIAGVKGAGSGNVQPGANISVSLISGLAKALGSNRARSVSAFAARIYSELSCTLSLVFM